MRSLHSHQKNRLIACVYVHAPAIRVSLETLLAFAEPMRQTAQALSQLVTADNVA
ncbi:hypothetical protein [Photorhabdus sp. CRCIA-P01]|uniref:hypothetical protein n=1 Tax=Photorhabdus sp. CRCIA-P01 TaxID=2019570 RepID=UPI0013006654|nr:hypothetical protein [Photorhabdus sp. CRCIA-P01]